MDKTGTVSIKQLKALALNPQKHIQKSILYHFSDQLKLNESVLNALDIEELNCLIHAFTVLKSNAGTKADMYDLAVKKNEQGQLLRLFLPHLAGIADPVYTKVLIDLLYLGIKRGPVSQGKAIASIKDKEFQELKDKELQELKLKELQGLAIDLHERFVCSKTIQTLGFKSDIISLAAKPKDDSASKFRQIILRVEDQCKQIYARLQSSSPDKQKAHAWQNTEKEYRKTLYTIASKAISDPDYDFRSQLDLEQTKILKIVDPEIKSLVETVLVVIANIFISVLTLGIANEIKYRKTGNYWFFNHSASGEELRALDKELTGIISPPTK